MMEDDDEMEDDILVAELGAEAMNVKAESEMVVRKRKQHEKKWREMKLEEEKYFNVQRLWEQDELLMKAEYEKKKLDLQAKMQSLEAERNNKRKLLTDNYAERARISEIGLSDDDMMAGGLKKVSILLVNVEVDVVLIMLLLVLVL